MIEGLFHGLLGFVIHMALRAVTGTWIAMSLLTCGRKTPPEDIYRPRTMTQPAASSQRATPTPKHAHEGQTPADQTPLQPGFIQVFKDRLTP